MTKQTNTQKIISRFREKFEFISHKGIQCDLITLTNMQKWLASELEGVEKDDKCEVCGNKPFGKYIVKHGKKKKPTYLCYSHLIDKTVKPYIVSMIIEKEISIDLSNPLYGLVESELSAGEEECVNCKAGNWCAGSKAHEEPQAEAHVNKTAKSEHEDNIMFSPPPREERDWDSWTEEFDDKWVDEHAEIVKADPKQLKAWIHNLLNSQLQEVRREIEEMRGGKQRLKKERFKESARLKLPPIEGAVFYQTVYEWAIDDILQALDEMEGGK